jgi:hypothetical protein
VNTHSDNLIQNDKTIPRFRSNTLKNMLKENDVQFTTPRPLEPLKEFCRKLESLKDGEEFNPKLLFNFDETKEGGEASKYKVAKINGDSKPSIIIPKNEEHITLVLLCSATGESFTPLAIFPLKTVPVLDDEIYESFLISGSESGWINGPIYKN